MTFPRRTAIVPRVVLSATAATVASIPIVACLSIDSGTNNNYIALAIAGFGAFGNGTGLSDTGGGIEVLIVGGAAGEGDAAAAGAAVSAGGVAGEAGLAGALSSGGVGFIVLAAAAFGGEAGGNER